LPSYKNIGVQLDENIFSLLALFSEIANSEAVPWILVGATARVVLLEKIYGWPKGIATEDTDFAVQVKNWDHYGSLCSRLENDETLNPLQHPTKRFVTTSNLLFDLLPYGGVETGVKQVYWPPHNEQLMTVRGFECAHEDAIQVRVNNKLNVLVISPRALCALKLFAWEERHAQHPGRDAKDLAYLFQNVENLYSAELLHTQYQDSVEAADYDIVLAALYQFGKSVIELLDSDDNKFLTDFLINEASQEDDSKLVRELHQYFFHKDIERTVKMFNFFCGLLS